MLCTMAKQEINPFSKQFTIIIGLTVVGFMAFGLTLSFYRNILFEETLRTLEQRNRDIATQIDKQYAELEYVRSDQFKDKFAKENLNRINPGEKILLLTRVPKDPLLPREENPADREHREAAYAELLQQMPVIEHWKLYLFRRSTLDELKAAL